MDKCLIKIHFKPYKGQSSVIQNFVNIMYLGTENMILTQHKTTGSPLPPEPKEANLSDGDEYIYVAAGDPGQ